MTETLTDRLGRAMERFLADFQPAAPVLVVAGGVAANQVLRHALGALCDLRGFRLSAPPPELAPTMPPWSPGPAPSISPAARQVRSTCRIARAGH